MFLPTDSPLDLTVRLEINKSRHVVLLGETLNAFLFVLANAALEKIGYAGIEDAGSASHDVDVVDGHSADCGMEVVPLSLSEVGLNWLPRSLRFMADVRAARTGEKVGHSGRDDNKGKFATPLPVAKRALFLSSRAEQPDFLPPRRILARRAA